MFSIMLIGTKIFQFNLINFKQSSHKYLNNFKQTCKDWYSRYSTVPCSYSTVQCTLMWFMLLIAFVVVHSVSAPSTRARSRMPSSMRLSPIRISAQPLHVYMLLCSSALCLVSRNPRSRPRRTFGPDLISTTVTDTTFGDEAPELHLRANTTTTATSTSTCLTTSRTPASLPQVKDHSSRAFFRRPVSLR